MQEESIYNLIPKEYNSPPKEKRHRSMFPPDLPPTGSTFNNKTTSRPNVSNLGGQYIMTHGPHVQTGEKKTFGVLKGASKPKASQFRKKNTGTMGDNSLPKVRGFKYSDEIKKPEVPCACEKPVMGLRTSKNYIVANAVENILALPKQMPEQIDWTKKRDYGKSPEYLCQIKEKVQNQYEMVRNLHLRQNSQLDRQKYLLSESEVKELRVGLKRKWEAVNQQYQKITHISKVDTLGLKRKKESCEKELAEIEQDMKKLSKQYIFVDSEK